MNAAIARGLSAIKPIAIADAITTHSAFGSLKGEMLQGVVTYLKNVGKGKNKPVGEAFKGAWVGFRGSDKYDAPNLFGFEVEGVDYKSDVDEMVGIQSIP